MLTPLPDNRTSRWILLLLLVLAVYFFHAFLVPVLGALIIGFASWPLYLRLLTLCRHNALLAASIAVLIIIMVLVIPISFAFSYAFKEVKGWVEWLIEINNQGAVMPTWLYSLPGLGDWLTPYWERYIAHPQALSELVQLLSGEQLGTLYRWLAALGSRAFHLLLILVFMIITLFFVYKDGPALARQLDRAGESLLGGRWARFSRMVPATVSSTVTGMGLIALGEGVILGIAYAIAGLPSPVALGVLTGFMALIPGGAPLCFTLASLYLVGSGEMVAGVGLFIWGSVELFIVDKTIRPRLVGGPSSCLFCRPSLA